MPRSFSESAPAAQPTRVTRSPCRGFSRAQRLISKQDYAYVFAKPYKIHHAFFTLLYRPGQRQVTRLGLAVSRKAMKHAVKRNRFKRILRESFRHYFLSGDDVNKNEHANLTSAPDQDTIATPNDRQQKWDIVVIAKAAAAGATNQTLRQAFDQTWPSLTAR